MICCALAPRECAHLDLLLRVLAKRSGYMAGKMEEGLKAELAVAGTLVPEDQRALDGFDIGPEGVMLSGDAAWCAAILAQVVKPRGAAVVARQVVGEVCLAAFVLSLGAFTELRLDDAGLMELAALRVALAAEQDECCRLRGEFESVAAVAELVGQVFDEHRAAARSVVNRVLLEDRYVVHVVHEGVIHGVYADPAVAAQVQRKHEALLFSTPVHTPGVLVEHPDGAVAVFDDAALIDAGEQDEEL